MKAQESVCTALLGETQLDAVSVEYAAVNFGTDGAEVRLKEGKTLWLWQSREEKPIPVALEAGDSEGEYRVYLNGEVVTVQLEKGKDRYLRSLKVATAGGRSAQLLVRAPMPGLLKSILVSPGDLIGAGDSLCILEAMKMENEIKSPGNYKVGSVNVEAGNPVEKGTTLIQLLPIEGD